MQAQRSGEACGVDLLLAAAGAERQCAAVGLAAAQTLLCTSDCSGLVVLCGEVLPDSLRALDPHHGGSEAALAAVQALGAALSAVGAALAQLQQHDGLGVISILCEAPGVWLGLHRSLRALTAQLSALLMPVRVARGSADAAAALQQAIASLTAVCQRSRDAARLFGAELPALARDVAASWEPGRLQSALEGFCCLSPAATASASGSGATSPATLSGQQPALRPRGWMVMTVASAARRLAAAGAEPVPTGVADEALLRSAVDRVQQLFLLDSEVDQLEQDRAYLLDRLATLRRQQQQPGAVVVDGGGDDARAQVVLAEVLLAAVDARVQALAAEEAACTVVADVTRHSGSPSSCGLRSSDSPKACAKGAGKKGQLGGGSQAAAAAAGSFSSLGSFPGGDEGGSSSGLLHRRTRMLLGCLPWVGAG